jgi:sugar phosphate isomerase/epimerase
MRIGTTSYIYPADIITNVRKLAGRVEDVELVIFEVDDQYNNLPDVPTINELRSIASDHGMTFTVHLPLDPGLADSGASLDKVLRTVDATAGLGPFGYVLHPDGIQAQGPDNLGPEFDAFIRGAERVIAEVGSPEMVCIENIENQQPFVLDAIFDLLPVSCCADIGHFWKLSMDPVPYLESWYQRTRVVHLHGVGSRDHKSLSLMPPSEIDEVVSRLCRGFHGVLTLEVFNERDLLASMDALSESMIRVTAD